MILFYFELYGLGSLVLGILYNLIYIFVLGFYDLGIYRLF